MGMRPEYYPRSYGSRPRRVQPTVAPQVGVVPLEPQVQIEPPSVSTAPPAALSPLTSGSSKRIIAIGREAARLGVIWSEVLAAPRARRPWVKQ